MKRGGPLKRSVGLRPMSRKKRAKTARRREVVRQVQERDPYCVVMWLLSRRTGGVTYAHIGGENVALKNCPWDCGGPRDTHEIIPRSAWTDGDMDPSNCVSVCRIHHDWIGDHPQEAHELGLHGYSWERPGAA